MATAPALRVTYEPDTVRAEVDVRRDVDLAEGPADVRRIRFIPDRPARRARIRLRIEPA